MLGYSININNLCCNPVVLKNIGETTKNWYFGTKLYKKWVSMCQNQNKNQYFLAEITDKKKVDHQFLET